MNSKCFELYHGMTLRCFMGYRNYTQSRNFLQLLVVKWTYLLGKSNSWISKEDLHIQKEHNWHIGSLHANFFHSTFWYFKMLCLYEQIHVKKSEKVKKTVVLFKLLVIKKLSNIDSWSKTKLKIWKNIIVLKNQNIWQL